MRRITALLATALVVAAGCQQETLPRIGRAIRCRVSDQGTKGTAVNASALQTTGFGMMAWLDENYRIDENNTGQAGLYFGSADAPAGVTYSAGEWSIAGEPVWIYNDLMRFWCWSPTSAPGTLSINPGSVDLTGKNTLTFSYFLPEGGATDGSKNACDADCQPDLVFAYNAADYQANGDDEVNFKFYHALAQINFIVKPQAAQTAGDGSLRSDYSIVDISLKDVITGGACTITGSSYTSTPKDGEPATTFSWTPGTVRSDYTQHYGASFSGSTPEGWTARGDGHFICSQSFFVTPQEIGPTTSLSVTFGNGDKQMTKSVALKGVGTAEDGKTAVTSWLDGRRYTYRLAISGDIADSGETFSVTLEDWAEVSDQMSF